MVTFEIRRFFKGLVYPCTNALPRCSARACWTRRPPLRRALRQTPTLVILDNLEALAGEQRQELLEAAARWSEQGGSRVLANTRGGDLGHPLWPAEESNLCRHLVLRGLAEHDALAWFQALMRLPPEPEAPLPQPEALVELFRRVEFHPLSVGVLARQLKTRRVADVGERLEALLPAMGGDPLLASLDLALERLDPVAKEALPRLGVFEGGAFEDDLLAVIELEEERWRPLRRGLEQAGLVHAEAVPGVGPPFLCFHPALAPALWRKLAPEARANLHVRHRERHYALASWLYEEDTHKNATRVRAIAQRALPNLLAAARGALDAGEPASVDFAQCIVRFLHAFGLRRDQADLGERARAKASERGSRDWNLTRSSLAEELSAAGRDAEAEVVLHDVLDHLGDEPSYERAMALGQPGRCQRKQGHAARAEEVYQRALAEAERLDASPDVRRLVGYIHADLGDARRVRGDRAGARTAYEASLAIAKELSDTRSAAVALGQLGSLALLERKLGEAEASFRSALETFHGLGEPRSEAVAWHQLGFTYAEGRRWAEAEQAYREFGAHQRRAGRPRCRGRDLGPISSADGSHG